MKILGLLDIATSITFIGVHLGFLSYALPLYALAYIAAKFLVFSKDFASMVELSCAVLLIMEMLGFSTKLMWIAAFFFAQKGFFSLK